MNIITVNPKKRKKKKKKPLNPWEKNPEDDMEKLGS